MINGITIDFWFSGNFTNMKDIKSKCYLIIDLSKFTYNKKIISGDYIKKTQGLYDDSLFH